MSFKTFESNKPLIYIHIYKTGGITISEYFKEWFCDEKYRFTHVHKLNQMCIFKIINDLKNENIINPIFYGHFLVNKQYTFIEQCTQFIATIRNPFDRTVSAFFYQNNGICTDKLSLVQYILTVDPPADLINIFSKEIITLENYKHVIKKYFIYIGLFENFNDNILNIASLLGKPANITNKVINKSQYTVDVPNYLREFHRNKFPLHYAIYDYIKQLHDI